MKKLVVLFFLIFATNLNAQFFSKKSQFELFDIRLYDSVEQHASSSEMRNKFDHIEANNFSRIILENTGNIGKSYRKHDEIGTPTCITIDYDSLAKNTVTLRDRDTMSQKTIDIDNISKHLLI